MTLSMHFLLRIFVAFNAFFLHFFCLTILLVLVLQQFYRLNISFVTNFFFDGSRKTEEVWTYGQLVECNISTPCAPGAYNTGASIFTLYVLSFGGLEDIWILFLNICQCQERDLDPYQYLLAFLDADFKILDSSRIRFGWVEDIWILFLNICQCQERDLDPYQYLLAFLD